MIFTLAKSLTCDTKLIEFQFKIIHRTYASNSFVANFNDTVSKICPYCDVEDNIVHAFVDCIKIKQFWNDFKDFTKIVLKTPFTLTTAEIIFGKLNTTYAATNFCILHAKWFIHLNKNQQIITFNQYKNYLRNVFTVEKQIYINNKKAEKFSKLYESYVKLLE